MLSQFSEDQIQSMKDEFYKEHVQGTFIANYWEKGGVEHFSMMHDWRDFVRSKTA